MASQSQVIPSVSHIKSQERICKGFQRVYCRELLMLEYHLENGEISQQVYDEAVAAIESDRQHLIGVVLSLTSKVTQ